MKEVRMTFRADAKKRLSTITLEPPKHPQPPIHPSGIVLINQQIAELLAFQTLSPLLDFFYEFSVGRTIQYGYLYDHQLNLPEFEPRLRSSANPRSQAYCAKLSLDKGYGDIFIIPSRDRFEGAVIILKPNRSLRRDRKVQNFTIKGFPVTLLIPPYKDIKDHLQDWAFSIVSFEYGL